MLKVVTEVGEVHGGDRTKVVSDNVEGLELKLHVTGAPKIAQQLSRVIYLF